MNNFVQIENKGIKEFKHLNEWPEKQFDYEIRQKHLTPYVEKRMDLYRAQDKDFFTKQFDKECYYLIKLSECERYQNEYIDEEISRYYHHVPDSAKITNITQELEYRVTIKQCLKHTSPEVEHEVRKIKKSNKLLSPYQELEQRVVILNKHNRNTDVWYENMDTDLQYGKEEIRKRLDMLNSDLRPETESELERMKRERQDIKNSDIMKHILFMEICQGLDVDFETYKYHLLKHSSPYIETEINRLKEKGQLKKPSEELKMRIHLEQFEIKDEEAQKQEVDIDIFKEKSLHGLKEINILKRELNKVGRGFCLAKWNQVSLLLQNGMTHSCHHPVPHKIPLDELKENKSALHNTKFKKLQRKMMLEGGRPKECDYCWKVEDANKDAFSDRHMKSAEAWALPDFRKIRDSDWREDTNPPYVEISFSNQCNFACSYCDVKSSSRWQQEIEKKGPYPTSGLFNNTDWLKRADMMPIPYKQFNPYEQAFWKWWPELYPDLHTLRITGGEPILHKGTFRVLDYIIENPDINPELEISINSNFCPPDDLFDKFIEKSKYITENDLVWNYSVYTSIESWGDQAEYIRDGLDFDKFWYNIDRFLTEVPKASVTIMSTYNALSAPNFDKLIEGVFHLKRKHYNGKRYRHYAILLDVAYLRQPSHQSLRILPTKWIDKMKEDIELMKKYREDKYLHIYGHGHSGYYDFEIEKFRRLIDYAESPLDDVDWLMKNRGDFFNFFNEYDNRRDKSFLETFPELADFWENCRRASWSVKVPKI